MSYDVNKYESDLEIAQIQKEKESKNRAERYSNKREKLINFLKNNEGKAFTAKEINNKLSIREAFSDESTYKTNYMLDGLVSNNGNIRLMLKDKYFLLLFDYTVCYYYYKTIPINLRD